MFFAEVYKICRKIMTLSNVYNYRKKFEAKDVMCCSFATVHCVPLSPQTKAFNFVELRATDVLYEKFSSVGISIKQK